MAFNPVVWFEIYVDDMARARAFYETVLAVTLAPLPMPEGEDLSPMQMLAFPAQMENAGAAGVLAKMDGVSGGGNSTIVYFGCEDCAVEASRVEAAGGRLQQGKTSLGEYGAMALAFDTEGNMFGLHSMA